MVNKKKKTNLKQSTPDLDTLSYSFEIPVESYNFNWLNTDMKSMKI